MRLRQANTSTSIYSRAFQVGYMSVTVDLADIRLYRYSTHLEMGLNAIGLLAASGAGAAMVCTSSMFDRPLLTVVQPILTILFGDLTKDFVTLAHLILQARNGVPGAAEAIPATAASFRSNSARISLWLALIGVFFSFSIHQHIE